MKKLVLILIIISLFTSCGPRRLSCGPGKRCVENATTKNHPLVKEQAQHS